MTSEAMKIIKLGMESDLDGMTEAMEEAFSALFVAACNHMTSEFKAWETGEPEESDPDGIDMASILAEFDKPVPTGEVQGAPV